MWFVSRARSPCPVLEWTLALCLCALMIGFTSSPVRASPPGGAPETYIVQPGDSLYGIALQYSTTVAVLKQLNGLTSDVLQVGQKLRVPGTDSAAAGAAAPVATVTYAVVPGDTLNKIAQRFGTTTQVLQELNGIANPNRISVGQVLVVPGGTIEAKPGIVLDPPVARQGGTLFVKVTKPNLTAVSGLLGSTPVTFTQAAGEFYAFVGISRCAKTGARALALTETDAAGISATLVMTVTISPTAFVVQNITLTGNAAAVLSDNTLIRREQAELMDLVRPRTATPLWSGPFRQPLTGTVSSYFGTRRSYNGGAVGACGHEGMDIAVPGGTPIYADARGRVVFAGETKVRGNLVVVDHGLGVYSAYFHQSQLNVKTGQMVEAGDLIGRVGTTGMSTGDHLHWSVFVNGEYVDPVEWTRRTLPLRQ